MLSGMAGDSEHEQGNDAATLWRAHSSHEVDHEEALRHALDEIREGLAAGSDGVARERIDAWGASRGPMLVRFHDDPTFEGQPWLQYGVWMLQGRASEHAEELRNILDQTGTGCAAHCFPVRLSADGTVFLPDDTACPVGATDGLALDTVCRWTNRHDTVAAPLIVDRDGGGTLGAPEPLDLDASVLDDAMPLVPPPARGRRRNRPTSMFTLGQANLLEPDEQHYHSTVENMAALFQVSEDLACWRRENVPVAHIDPFQLIDDPDDLDGEAKVEAIRKAMQEGARMPAVITVHEPDAEFPYFLAEGRHRYNAAHREAAPAIAAWVAHIGCCSGPEADLPPA